MKKKIISQLLLLLTINIFLIGIYAQTEQKAELVVQTGHTLWVNSVAFSPDGQILASGSFDKTLKLWDIQTGKELKTLKGHTEPILSVAFAPDGQTLASASGDNTLKLWDIQTGKELKTFSGHTSVVRSVAFSPDGKTLASGSNDRTVRLWEINTGKELITLKGHIDSVYSVAFSPDGQTLASGSFDKTIKLWNIETEKELKTLAEHTSYVFSVAFSPDGKTLASGSTDKTIRLWDIDTGKELKTFSGHTSVVRSVAFSPDGKTLASGSEDNTIKLWDIQTDQELKTLAGHTGEIPSVAFSRDGKILASGSFAGLEFTVKLWNIQTGQELKTLAGHTSEVFSAAFSSDGKTLASGSWKTIKLWNIQTGQELETLKGHTLWVNSVAFSPDGQTLASGSEDATVKLWDINTGKELKTLSGHDDSVQSVAFSPDGKTVASGSWKTIKLWDAVSGKKLKTLSGHTRWVESVAFSSDGKTLASGSEDNTVKLWDTVSGTELRSFQKDDPAKAREVSKIVPDLYRQGYSAIKGYSEPIAVDDRFQIKIGENGKLNLHQVKTGKLLASLIGFDGGDWAVVTPEGLFDASPRGRNLMHFIIGLEPISLEQMKDVYYYPGLWKKIFKGDSKLIAQVELFSQKDLFPEVEFSQPKTRLQNLSVKLTNRGGGIGRVQVLINGKEFVADARPAGFDPNTKQITLTVSLKDAPFISGEENKIEIVAGNSSGSLTNRGTSRGNEIVDFDEDETVADVNIYAIVGGISNYAASNLNLKFGAKDSEDFAKALELGAVSLLGDKSKVHIRLLTSNGANSNVTFEVPDAKITTATKKDFEQAFKDFSGATSDDVFIVYLAGHGVSLNLNQNPDQAGGDTYLYLTQEATTGDKTVLFIKNSREAMTLSGEEIKELMKINKALKQVLILDTCAAGRVAGSLVANRDLPSDQIRAIERLKDNTGFYVLMGASADAVSYEASQYGQGLLTYSLLQGMKGARLRENQYADIRDLFTYAQERVPQMAKNIGGIQRPEVITPDTSRSFDIGRFTKEGQAKIILSNPKPLILRPNLQNEKEYSDDLGLTILLRTELRNINYVNSRGKPAQIVFVEVDEMLDAVKLNGRYTVDGNDITVKFVLTRNNKRISEVITVTGKVNEKETLVKRLVEEMIKAARKNVK